MGKFFYNACPMLEREFRFMVDLNKNVNILFRTPHLMHCLLYAFTGAGRPLRFPEGTAEGRIIDHTSHCGVFNRIVIV